MERLEVQTIIRRVKDDGSVVNIENRTDKFNRVEGVDDQKFTLNNAAGTIDLDLAPADNVNYIYVKGTYQADDLPNNISKGDPAPFDVQINNSGVFTAVSPIASLGMAVTNIKVKTADVRNIDIVLCYSAIGS